MPIIPCTGQSEARGRNRWFRIAEAVLTAHAHEAAEEARFWLHVYSRRRGHMAPVVLALTPADATALAQALQDALQQWCPVTQADHLSCPHCHTAESLAYGALSVEDTLVIQDAVCLTCGTSWHDIYTYHGLVVHDA